MIVAHMQAGQGDKLAKPVTAPFETFGEALRLFAQAADETDARRGQAPVGTFIEIRLEMVDDESLAEQWAA